MTRCSRRPGRTPRSPHRPEPTLSLLLQLRIQSLSVGGERVSCTLYSTSCIIRPTPYTLHPKPYTLHVQMCGDLATVLSVGEERISLMGFERGSVVAKINLLASGDPLMEVSLKTLREGLQG